LKQFCSERVVAAYSFFLVLFSFWAALLYFKIKKEKEKESKNMQTRKKEKLYLQKRKKKITNIQISGFLSIIIHQ
jgi:hypothetical protein